MIGQDLGLAARLLRDGQLVAIPTETVYGLGANALDTEAVMRLFTAKRRPYFDPIIVHIGSYDQIGSLVTAIPKNAKVLADAFWPGPLTLILPKSNLVPDIVTSGLPFVGVRIPRHSLTNTLLKSIDFPVAAPSANPFGYVSPTSAEHVADQLEHEVNYILDGGPCIVGLESTIVSFINEDTPTILRYGGVSVEEIEALIGKVRIDISNGIRPDAPGQLDKHYATNKRLSIVKKFSNGSVFKIGYGKGQKVDYNLSNTASLPEAAHNLFHALRLADKSDYESIEVKAVPNFGLGLAINDRLRRAAII